MNLLHTSRNLLAATGLALFGFAAQASSLSLQDAYKVQAHGAFSHSLSLQLDERSSVSIWLQGWSQKGALPSSGNPTGALAASDLHISSLILSNGVQTFYFDGQPGHFSLGTPLMGSESRGNPGSRPWTAFLQTYELQPLLLDAGAWTLTVNGFDEHLKFASGLDLRVQAQQAPNAVPAPAAFGLAALALLIGGLMSRKQRA